MKKLYQFIVPIMFLAVSGCAAHPPASAERQDVRKYSTPEVAFNYEVRSESPDQSRVNGILDVLENVPDCLQKKFNDAGGKVFIFDGQLTSQPEFDYLKGRTNFSGYSWDSVPGAYSFPYRAVAISQDFEGDSSSRNLSLHEITHGLLDVFYGRDKWYIDIGEDSKEALADYGADYFYSDLSREKLKSRNKKVYNFFRNMEGFCKN